MFTAWPVTPRFKLARAWTFSGPPRDTRPRHLQVVRVARARRPRGRALRAAARRQHVRRSLTLRNRVTPLSELIADPARGLVYGNRGCLHDEPARSAGATTASAGSPAGSSSAAGCAAAAAARPLHRALLPRRGDGVRRRPSALRALPPRGLRQLRRRVARRASGPRGADEIDEQLHAERVAPGTRAQLHHNARARRASRRRFRPARRRPVGRRRGALWRWTPPATRSGSAGGPSRPS